MEQKVGPIIDIERKKIDKKIRESKSYVKNTGLM